MRHTQVHQVIIDCAQSASDRDRILLVGRKQTNGTPAPPRDDIDILERKNRPVVRAGGTRVLGSQDGRLRSRHYVPIMYDFRCWTLPW